MTTIKVYDSTLVRYTLRARRRRRHGRPRGHRRRWQIRERGVVKMSALNEFPDAIVGEVIADRVFYGR